jgi:hypothetical protein
VVQNTVYPQDELLMKYTPHNISQLDLTKYERIFTFGCSFTRYYWATWADLIASEIPHVEHINYGRCGAGQQFIQAMISQALIKHKPTSKDLLAVMYTTHYREDRHMGTNEHTHEPEWKTPGNIYSQGDYPMSFVEQFCVPRGMTIRDCAIMHSCDAMLDSEQFDSVQFQGVGVPKQEWYGHGGDCNDTSVNADINEYYSDLLNNHLMPDLLNTQMGGEWPVYYTYNGGPDCGYENVMVPDYHPHSISYREYLIKCGLPMGERSERLANQSHALMQGITHRDQLNAQDWPWNDIGYSFGGHL